MDSRRDRSQRIPDRFEQRLGRWLDTGRHIVDGVSGARPGSRSVNSVTGISRLDDVGRWVGDRIDWLLDEEVDCRDVYKRSQWLETVPPEMKDSSKSLDVSESLGRKRPLEAVSRRQPVLVNSKLPSSSSTSVEDDGIWPEDDIFRVQRWKRSSVCVDDVNPLQPSISSSSIPGLQSRRLLPRSSRRLT